MSDLFHLEDLIHGPDGDKDRGILPTIQEAIRRAAGVKDKEGNPAPVKYVSVDIRKVPALAGGGEGPSESCGAFNFAAETDDPARVADTMLRSLRADPGEGYSGKIRIMFRECGGSATLGSYQRPIRGGSLPVQGGADVNAILANTTGPLCDRIVQLADANVRMADGVARAVTGFGNALGAIATGFKALTNPATADGDSGLLGTLGKMVLGIGGEAIGGKAGAVMQGAARVLPRGGDAPPLAPGQEAPPSTAPAPLTGGATGAASATPTGGGIDRAAVERWAAQNPVEARSMVADTLAARGAPAAIVAMVRE